MLPGHLPTLNNNQSIYNRHMRKFVEILKIDDRLIAAKCLKYSFVNNQIWPRSCLRKVALPIKSPIETIKSGLKKK